MPIRTLSYLPVCILTSHYHQFFLHDAFLYDMGIIVPFIYISLLRLRCDVSNVCRRRVFGYNLISFASEASVRSRSMRSFSADPSSHANNTHILEGYILYDAWQTMTFKQIIMLDCIVVFINIVYGCWMWSGLDSVISFDRCEVSSEVETLELHSCL